jgi:superoxide dismutase
VSSVLDNLKDLIANKDNKFIVKNLTNVKSTIEQALPGYQQAQQVFAAASPPVNQAKVLGAMQQVLTQPLGVGERAGPFMTALGRGETALLKKSTGAARYDDLSQVLSPQQMNVVKGVESELKRNAEVVRQTQAGADAMKIILEANQSKFRLPSFLDVKVTVTNQMLDILKDKMSANVLKELEKGFASAKNFETLMKKVPASQRLDVLRALGQANLSPTKLNIITQTQNALAPTQENRNALTVDLKGMAPQYD